MDETDILKERKERILAYMESEGYVPIKRRDMRAMLSVPQEDREKFENLINELIADLCYRMKISFFMFDCRHCNIDLLCLISFL